MLVRQLALGRELTGGATTTFSRRSAFFKADAQFLCRADDLRLDLTNASTATHGTKREFGARLN